jgi:hypothetical protein
LREAVDLSADAVAEQMACSQTKITRIENALSGVSRGDLYLMLDIYGVKDKERRESYWALALAGRERGWWQSFKDVIGETLGEYIAFESSANDIRTWSLGTIHGLLQTEAYARATFAGGPPRTPEEVDRVVTARMERQKRLRSGELALWAILDESLLSRPIGGPTVLRDQLDHLLRLPAGVTLQVVPTGARWHPGLSCAFTLMNFTDYPSVAFVEAFPRDVHIDLAADVSGYSLMFDQLRAAGANPESSRELIEAARDRLTPEPE